MISKLVKLLPYARRQWRGLAVILGLTLAMSLIAAAQPWPLKILVDYGLGQGDAEGGALRFLAAYPPMTLIIASAVAALIITALSMLLDAAMTWMTSLTGERMTKRLSADLFDRLQRLSLRFHSHNQAGDALSRVTADAYCVYRVTDAVLISPVHRLGTLVFLSLVAWRLDPVLTLVLLGITPPLIAFAWYFGPRIRKQSLEKRDRRAALTSFVQQTLAALPVVQAFNTQQRNDRRFDELAEQYTSAVRRSSATDDVYKLVNGLGTTITVAVVLFLGGQRVLIGAMTIGSLLVFLQYGRTMLSSVRDLLGVYGKLRGAEANVDRVLEILESVDRVPEPASPIDLPAPEGGRGSRVVFDHVTYGYDPELPVLRDVALTVEPGESVALVGATGAGKTTLASMIPRFMDPQEGGVRIDGVDIRQVRLIDLRRRIGFVLQQPLLMPLTIAENIAYGRPDATIEQVTRAAEAANADGFIRQLPEGYLTTLHERGGGLSGGEKQRIAIARAILNDAAIIILDEPTAALDTETELVVMDAVGRLTADRTTFIIAHRLSTARRADRIVVLDEGRIAEVGTHDQLLARPDGLYRHLYRLQAAAPDGGQL